MLVFVYAISRGYHIIRLINTVHFIFNERQKARRRDKKKIIYHYTKTNIVAKSNLRRDKDK